LTPTPAFWRPGHGAAQGPGLHGLSIRDRHHDPRLEAPGQSRALDGARRRRRAVRRGLVAARQGPRSAVDGLALFLRIVAAESVTRGLDQGQRFESRDPCALLLDDLCSVYPARPLACRAFASFSVEACRISFEGGSDDIHTLGATMMLRSACDQAMFAALRMAGLPDISYELNHAVAVALTTDDAERRWLAGESIFEAVAPDPASSIRPQWIDDLVAVSRGEEAPAS
jgi:hypothetical protein